MHYLLFYEVGEDYIARRAEFRNAHLEMAWKASERGELLLAGALDNPATPHCCCSRATRLMSPKSLPGRTLMSRTGS